MTKQPHISILLPEWLDSLKDKTLNTYVDGTLGAGGHALGVLESHPEIKKFIGIDQDTHAIRIAEEHLKKWEKKLTIVHDNFSHLGHYCR